MRRFRLNIAPAAASSFRRKIPLNPPFTRGIFAVALPLKMGTFAGYLKSVYIDLLPAPPENTFDRADRIYSMAIYKAKVQRKTDRRVAPIDVRHPKKCG